MRGALAAGSLAAALPLFLEYTSQTRGYSFAWSLALLSYVAIALVGSRWKIVVGGILIGLALATRVEMGPLPTYIATEVARTEPKGRRFSVSAAFAGIAILCVLIAAPW